MQGVLSHVQKNLYCHIGKTSNYKLCELNLFHVPKFYKQIVVSSVTTIFCQLSQLFNLLFKNLILIKTLNTLILA